MNNLKCNICFNSLNEKKQLTYFKCVNCVKKEDKLICNDCIEKNSKNCNNICPFCKSPENKEISVDIIKLEDNTENIIIIKNKFTCTRIKKIKKSIKLFLIKLIDDIKDIKCRKTNRIVSVNDEHNNNYSFCSILMTINIILRLILMIIGWTVISYSFFMMICGNSECYICHILSFLSIIYLFLHFLRLYGCLKNDFICLIWAIFVSLNYVFAISCDDTCNINMNEYMILIIPLTLFFTYLFFYSKLVDDT